MTDIVNLNKYRKKRKKDDRENEAVENRAKFGRTKGERTRDETEKKSPRRKADRERAETQRTARSGVKDATKRPRGGYFSKRRCGLVFLNAAVGGIT